MGFSFSGSTESGISLRHGSGFAVHHRHIRVFFAVLVLAQVGPLHAQSPMFNAQTVLEIVRFCGAKRAVLTDLSPADWSSGAWHDTENPVLFALEDDRIPVTAIGPDWAWALSEQAQMFEFLKQFPAGRTRLQDAGRAEANLRDALTKPLEASVVHTELLEVMHEFQTLTTAALEEGPGTAHRVKRLELVKKNLRGLDLTDCVVIAPLDDVPALLGLPNAQVPDLRDFKPGEASRFRSVVDRAYRLEESDDLNILVHALLELDGPPDSSLGRIALEARFAASGLYLAVGDLESARDLLEAVAMGQFDRPAYLPGFVLSRLGQVRDLQLERDMAVRAYRAALGLSWLPLEARQVCESGLERPFRLA
jgi:hypothetical protein